jgi:hypothetical protein
VPRGCILGKLMGFLSIFSGKENPSGLVLELPTFSDVDSLLDLLNPQNSLWGRGQNWVFRGQTCDKPLLPSAHRVGTMPVGYTWDLQLKWEARLFDAFLKECNRLGLSLGSPIPGMIPDADVVIFESMLRPYDSASDGFPKSWHIENLAFLGLAQHFGVPTQLLDWTKNRYKALLFSLDVPRRAVESPVIWAFNRIEWVTKYSPANYQVGDLSIRFLFPAHLDNPRLLAQEGLFSMSYHPQNQRDPFSPTAIDYRVRKVEEIFLKKNPNALLNPVLVKIPIHTSICQEIEVRLADYGYDYASIYPELAAVASEVRRTNRT